MVETGEDRDPDDAERIASSHRTVKDGWQRTLEDMAAMAANREDKGFQTLTVPAGDTAPEPPHAGEDDRWGISFVVPGNKADRLAEFHRTCEFEDVGVYQAAGSGQVFLVVELVDPDDSVAVFLAGHYEMRHAPDLVRTATEEGVMFVHAQTLDGTHLASVRHDDPYDFFPDPDEFLAYEM